MLTGYTIMPEEEETMVKWKKSLTLCINAVITWYGPPNISTGYYKGTYSRNFRECSVFYGWESSNVQLGAYNPKDGEAEVRDYESLNREAVIDFLEELRERNGKTKVHGICDNARYQHAKEVKKAAQEKDITLVYLPGYSPNLTNIYKTINS